MTTSPPTLRRNFSWTFVGNLVYATGLWGILAVLTRLGDLETVGRFSLASAIATPVIVLVNLQLRAVLTTDAAADHALGDYIMLRLLVLPPALLVVLVIAALGYSGSQVVAIGLFALARSVESLSDILYGYEQKRERLDLVARSMMIKGVASVTLVAGAFHLTRNLSWALGALVTAWLVPLVFYDVPQCRRLAATRPGDSLRPVWNPVALRTLVWTSLPLGAVMLLVQLRNTIPRTILEAEWGEEALGVFAALAYLVIVGTTVTMALSQSSLARLAVYYAQGNADAFRRTVLKLLLLGTGLGVAAVLVARLLGERLLTAIYGAEYASHADLLVLIMAAGGVLFVANLLGAPATASRNFRGQMVVHLIAAAILYGLGRTLIPRLGLDGAAYTMLGGALWVTTGYGWLVWNSYRKLKAGSAPEVTA